MTVQVDWHLSEDKRTVRIKFPDQDYSAADLLALVPIIAAIREQTEPPIPNDPDLLTPVRALFNPRWYVARDAMNDVIVLQLRVPGLGWIPSAIPLAEAEKLRDLLVGLLQGPSAPPASEAH